MGKVYVAIMPDFHMGEAALLVSGDHGGIGELQEALAQAARTSTPSVWSSGTQSHAFVIEVEGERVELHGDNVVWRLSDEKLGELLGKLESLRSAKSACHHYVDIEGPVQTLVLSRDEYVDLFVD